MPLGINFRGNSSPSRSDIVAPPDTSRNVLQDILGVKPPIKNPWNATPAPPSSHERMVEDFLNLGNEPLSPQVLLSRLMNQFGASSGARGAGGTEGGSSAIRGNPVLGSARDGGATGGPITGPNASSAKPGSNSSGGPVSGVRHGATVDGVSASANKTSPSAGGMDWKTIAMLSLLGIPIAGLGTYGAYKMMGGGKKRDEEKRSSVKEIAVDQLSRLLLTVKQANCRPAAVEDFVQYLTTAAVKLPAEKIAGVVTLCQNVRNGDSVVAALQKQNPSWTYDQCKAAAAKLVHAVYN